MTRTNREMVQKKTQYTNLKLKLRSGLMTVLFRKCLHVSLAERSKFSEGEIQTFILPLQIGIALYLLYTQVQFAFVAGITITILLIPVNKWIAELIAKATKNMEQKDERVRRTGELLTYIRTLKMYGWELLFTSWLMKTRSLEVKYLSTRKYLDAWCVFFWATTPTLFSFFTFRLYVLMGNQLDAATIPWIQLGTICDNVIFGKNYDPRRYSNVLEACALDTDVSLFYARLALARCQFLFLNPNITNKSIILHGSYYIYGEI